MERTAEVAGDYELVPTGVSVRSASGNDAMQGRCHYLSTLVDIFGWRFMLLMSIMYMGIKGLLASSLQLVELPLCKFALGVDGASCQALTVLAHTPRATKGAVAAFCDIFPFCGYTKPVTSSRALRLAPCASRVLPSHTHQACTRQPCY